MKILITTDWYKPVVNGVVISVLNLKRGLEAEGHEVRVLTLSDNVHSHRDGDVWYIRSLTAEKIYPQARISIYMKDHCIREALEWKPDIVHSQCELSTFLMAKRIAKKCNAPLIHTYHTVYEDYTSYFIHSKRVGKKITKVFSKRVLDHTDAVIVPSGKVKDLLGRYNVERPIYVIPSGIRLDKYFEDNSVHGERIREELGIKPDEIILLYVGRLAKEKNIEQIFKMLADCDPGQRLMVVGGGPYLEKLIRTADKDGVADKILFTGMVPPANIVDYYAAGDIFVSASSSETQGLTYMEAMASGLPILCKNDDCLNDVVDNEKNGYVWDTEEGFKSYLDSLRKDKDLRKNIGDAARESMKRKFSIRTFAQSCLEVYSKALEHRA